MRNDNDKEGTGTEKKRIDLSVEPHPSPESTDMGGGDPSAGTTRPCGRGSKATCSGVPNAATVDD